MRGINVQKVLLLDKATTMNQLCNPMLLNGIHAVSPEIKMHCNTGTKMNMTKVHMGSIEMWINSMGIVNVVLIKSLTDKYHLRFSS